MKTIFIFDQCGESPLIFAVTEGDYSHLDDVFLNSCENEDKHEELDKILQTLEWLADFPVSEVEKDTKVITVGFMP